MLKWQINKMEYFVAIAFFSIPIVLYVKDEELKNKITNLVAVAYFILPMFIYFLSPNVDRSAYIFLYDLVTAIFKFLLWFIKGPNP